MGALPAGWQAKWVLASLWVLARWVLATDMWRISLHIAARTVTATKRGASTAKSYAPWRAGRCGMQHPPELDELAAQRGRLVGRVCPVQACGAGRGHSKVDGRQRGRT